MTLRRATTIQFREKRAAFLCLVPALLLYMVFVLVPQILNLTYSFTDYDGFDPAFSFVGIDNFTKAIGNDPDLLQALGNTLVFSIFSLVIGLVLQFFLASMLHRGMRGGGFLKGLLYLPMIISMLILAVIWGGILKYNGILNKILSFAGLIDENIDWLGSPILAMGSLIFINTWTYLGYGTIIFLAGLNTIPAEITESADLDGATGGKRLMFITLPLMMNSITVSLFIGLTGAIKVFDLPIILTNGGPVNATTTIAMVIYKAAFDYQRFGYSSAVAVLFTLFIGALTLVQIRATKSREVEY
jgi:ABC-type sugar transport system permease subunit